MAMTAKMPRPADLIELRNMIAHRDVTLGSGLETVARYLLDHPLEAAFGTCHAIAVQCDVSPATVNRLASSFGFDKYAEFRELFRQPLRSGPPDDAGPDAAAGHRTTTPKEGDSHEL